ncbi:substrate-binding periplasmic protein [Undibacterium sp. RuRC25W]|uniref:substrate-binding periplasmic protein n=1 Tax=Undibacterium sp. RuRC25W TaxID=3413047 RepID=UPI003BF1918E
MSNLQSFRSLKGLLVLLLAGVSLSALARCSRPMNVPVAATGLSVIDQGEIISGIYPEILRSVAAKKGCVFLITLVPRARLELMFETGEADLMIPATRTPHRDQYGMFIPLIRNRAVLMSIQTTLPAVKTMQDLLSQPKSKVAVVRGFDYGERYLELITELQKQGRLVVDTDPLSVARLLKLGSVDYALMGPTILAGTSQTDQRVEDMVNHLRYETLAEMPWGESGVYFSKKALSIEDRHALQEIFLYIESKGLVWKGFRRYYREELLQEGVRPL